MWDSFLISTSHKVPFKHAHFELESTISPTVIAAVKSAMQRVGGWNGRDTGNPTPRGKGTGKDQGGGDCEVAQWPPQNGVNTPAFQHCGTCYNEKQHILKKCKLCRSCHHQVVWMRVHHNGVNTSLHEDKFQAILSHPIHTDCDDD